MVRVWYIILLLAVCIYAEASDFRSFRIVFYNVENLFDTRKDSAKQDEEFLPESPRKWNYTKYRKKQLDISRVLCAIGEWDIPALAGLCEVENDSVLMYLTRRTPLRELGYRYVMTDSPDRRGVDVGLLYQPDQFRLIESNSIRQPLELPPTRDILHVTGQVMSGDTMDVFVCHLPSRRNGERLTNVVRKRASATLMRYVDSVASVRLTPVIIVMGDMNDGDPQALFDVSADKLIHVSHGQNNTGSYYFQNAWETIDHFLVSPYLNDSANNVSVFQSKSFIFAPDFLLQENKKGEKVPKRTFRGTFYTGGYSDHLPVFMDLKIKL
ncbi:MAG: endonuclease [Bacteroidales bacterium]